MILGQKSSLDLVQQSMEDEVAADVFQEPIDKKIAVVEKVAEAVGLRNGHAARDGRRTLRDDQRPQVQYGRPPARERRGRRPRSGLEHLFMRPRATRPPGNR